MKVLNGANRVIPKVVLTSSLNLGLYSIKWGTRRMTRAQRKKRGVNLLGGRGGDLI